MKNIACNLIYNNGDEHIFVGFNGRCNTQNIIYNVTLDKGRWCSQPECSCRKFYDMDFTGKIDDYPCNESRLFKDWEWNPGNEFKTGNHFRILKSGAGKLAILTTRYANCPEAERKIIGFLKIKDIVDDHYKVVGLRKQSLRLTNDEAKDLNFWNYHKNNKNPAIPMWRQGRFRYLEDDQVAAILHDLKDVAQNETTQSLISELLENDFTAFSKIRPPITGALHENIVKKIWLRRKYGKGGESKEHKQLKEYISKNPDKIGLIKNQVKSFVEHPYVSGDLVDILFQPLKGNNNTVVEIELDNVMPGIHQAIKYRVLRSSQLGFPLTNTDVKATVVAWKLNPQEKALCKKYDINFFEIKL
jgi:hypothetical protein